MSLRFPVRVDSAAVHTSLSVIGLAVVAVAAGLLTACSSGPSPAGAGSGNNGQSGNSGSQVASSGGGGSIADGLGHPVNVCSLLPAATAASLSGEPITQAQEDDTPSYKLYTCNYTSADGTTGFDISVLALDAVAGYDASASVSTVTQISGLGDKAYSSITGTIALFGNVSINVSNLASASAAEAIIRNLQPKL